MNKVEYKYRPGDKVFAINKYPAGARIFETEILDVLIDVSKAAGTRIEYHTSAPIMRMFHENEIFAKEEEAAEARREYLEGIEQSENDNKQQKRKHNNRS